MNYKTKKKTTLIHSQIIRFFYLFINRMMRDLHHKKLFKNYFPLEKWEQIQ